MTKRLFQIYAAGLLAAAAAAQSAGSSAIASQPAAIASRLTANDLKADVSFLASDALEGRGTPSRGLDTAAEFIAAQFRRAGLEPAGDEGYFANAAFRTVTPVAEGLQLTLETPGGRLAVNTQAMTIQEAAALDVTGAPVLRISPVNPEQITAEQARGKVLVAMLPEGGREGFAAMRRLTAMAAKAHPALLIVVRSTPQPAPGNARLREVSAGEQAVPVLAVWDAAAGRALESNDEITVSAHIAAPLTTPVKLHNVIGVLRGSDPLLRNTYLLVTAHYDHLGVRGSGPGDHIYNGANDDASGTASVIEVAQTLAALPERPKRSIVFMALFGEELGLVGSRYYAAHPVFPLAATVADLNLEQMGRTDDNTGPRVGLMNVTGYDYTSIPAMLAQAGQPFGIKVVKDEAASDAFFARSDNQALADAGIPAHTLSVGYVFPDYHQPGDEWPKLDYENMAKVDRAVALAVYEIADSRDVPRWNSENPKTERYVKAQQALEGR